ncbi:MAG: hypothetical protein A3H92_05600 [Rhodospirillales bacterium RIFCSPLOWO2_02_FULL_58_16]|nr:MAG: hypothetical protein A3H92_05600 [Rhodospirillales bacterium RIFCSPLOWO2_02_FULL_58_16]
MRWIKPDGSVIPPIDFLPQCENSGFITDITAVMLPELIENIEAVREVKTDIQIAFNVSSLDLRSPYLVKMLRSFIGSRRIDPGNIQIEITETAIVDSSARISMCLFDLVALGIEVVMDDYGTGYSSLDVLSRLPFSAIKLDQGVVGRMSKDARNTHIVQSSLYMARELSLKTIAEGVENKCVYTFLMASGCNEVQGYWISRPVPLADFIAMCSSDRQWPSSSLGILYNAWVNHISYRRKVLDAVYTLTKTSPGEWSDLPKMDMAHSPARCRLGQWYLKKGRRNEDIGEFRHPTDPHERMHAAGEALERTVRSQSGEPAIKAALKTFLELSDIVDAEVSRIVEDGLAASLSGLKAAAVSD